MQDDAKDPIDEFLGLEPMVEPVGGLPAVTQVNEEPIETGDDPRLEDDYESARQDIDSIIELGMDALIEFRQVAKQSQQARAYEVLSTMIKTMLDASQSKLDAAAKKTTIEKVRNGGVAPVTVKNQKNTVFIGTTAALQKYLEQNGLPEPEHDDKQDPFIED